MVIKYQIWNEVNPKLVKVTGVSKMILDAFDRVCFSVSEGNGNPRNIWIRHVSDDMYNTIVDELFEKGKIDLTRLSKDTFESK